jgi:probable HAF family extracellular repeat protein
LRYHGTFTTIDFPGATFTFAGGNNPEGEVVGAYTDTTNVTHAFLLSNGVFTSFDPPGAVFSDAAGINPGGVAVGVYLDSAFVEHGFVRTP